MLIQNVLFAKHFELFWLMQLINIDTLNPISNYAKIFLAPFQKADLHFTPDCISCSPQKHGLTDTVQMFTDALTDFQDFGFL